MRFPVNSVRFPVNPLELKAVNYGSTDYDDCQTVAANYLYTIPGSHFHNAVLKGVLGGWTAAGTFLFHAGYPFSVIDRSVRSKQLSNVTGLAQPTHPRPNTWAPDRLRAATPNVACLTASQFATSGGQDVLSNVPRNFFFRCPGYFTTDLNINKAFTYKERYKLTVGVYIFNLFNHANFDLPFQNVATGEFGQILETVSPPTSAYGTVVGSSVSGRVIQTLVKFQF